MRATLKLPLIITCLTLLASGALVTAARTAYSQNEAEAVTVPAADAAAVPETPAPAQGNDAPASKVENKDESKDEAKVEAVIEAVIEAEPPAETDAPVGSPAGSKIDAEADPRAVIEAVASEAPFTVVELFSSQACVFCTQADELFAALMTVPHVIGFSCHVDYFDVRVGSLSRPFCSARQTWYMQTLGAGPNYTPQIVINGAADVIGYKLEEVTAAMKKAEKNPPLRMEITPAAAAGHYDLTWKPQEAPAVNEPAVLWLMMIDQPHTLTIADGRNKGKTMTYVNIVSDMEDRGDWDRAANAKTISAALKAEHQGFVVIAQSRQSGKILAAGEYRAAAQTAPAHTSE